MSKNGFFVPLVALMAAGSTMACSRQMEATAGMPAPAAMNTMLATWSEPSQKAADAMMQKYGAPQGMTPTMLVWQNNGPFRTTILYRDPVPHHFPKHHPDVLEQVIDYQVPIDKYDDLAAFDGSVIVERTKGTMAARCDKEPMNFLALNLAHEIVLGKRTVENARQEYANQVKMFMAGQKTPYTSGLMFTLAPGNARDPDHAIME